MTKRFLLPVFLAACALHAAETPNPVRLVDPEGKSGDAHAVVVEAANLAHTTQLLPVNARGEILGEGKADQQLKAVLDSVSMALQTGNSDLKHVVKINVYAANNDVVAQVQKFFAKTFKSDDRPAVTYVISKLADPKALVAMDAIGISTQPASESMVIRTHDKQISGGENFADVAVLPKGGVVYISGQAIKGPLPEATTKTLEQLEQTLKFLKLEKRDIVSAKAFVQPATDAATVRAEFAKFFKGELVPPLSLVDWTSGKELPIEIEMVVAARGTGADAKERISYLCPPFMTGSPVYSKIARVNSGKLIYFSGLVGKSSDSAESEIHEIFAQLKDLAKETKSDMDHLAKATYYVSTPQTSGKLNEIRPKYYNPKTPPAASKAMVKGSGFAGKGITFDMIAVTAE